ncbi:hypothetical protein, partial [Archaeoglobus sp.]
PVPSAFSARLHTGVKGWLITLLSLRSGLFALALPLSSHRKRSNSKWNSKYLKLPPPPCVSPL